jgi:hypothetical protein
MTRGKGSGFGDTYHTGRLGDRARRDGLAAINRRLSPHTAGFPYPLSTTHYPLSTPRHGLSLTISVPTPLLV